jgi:O-antigen/teichoic acid export membrane protein
MPFNRTIPAIYRSEKFWVLGDQLLVSGAGFFTTILAARQLGLQAFGWFASVVLAQLFVLTVQNGIITGPYQVLQAEQQKDEGPTYVNATLILQCGFIAVVILAGCILFFARPVFLQPFLTSWWWIVLAVTGYLLQDYLRRIFMAGGKAMLAFVIDAITNLLQLFILLYFFVKHQLHFTNCIMVMGLTFIPSVLLGIFLLKWKWVTGPEMKSALQKQLHHGKWLLLTALLQWWTGNSFIVAAGMLLGVTSFAALRLAQNIFGVLNVLFQAFENYVIPNAARIYKKSAGDLQPYLKIVSIKTAALVIPVLLVVIFFARFIFYIAGGAQYTSYAIILQGMSVLYLVIFLGYPVRIAIRVLLMNKSFFTGYCVTAVFSLLAAASFIRCWGVGGVIAGLAINQLLMIGYWLFILQKRNFILWK